MPLAMTAHVVFATIDDRHPATLSRVVFEEIIRGDIGYEGLVVTDDLSMKALSGSFAERARRAYAAGCDIVLHCNGEREEMEAVASAARPLAPGRLAAGPKRTRANPGAQRAGSLSILWMDGASSMLCLREPADRSRIC